MVLHHRNCTSAQDLKPDTRLTACCTALLPLNIHLILMILLEREYSPWQETSFNRSSLYDFLSKCFWGFFLHFQDFATAFVLFCFRVVCSHCNLLFMYLHFYCLILHCSVLILLLSSISHSHLKGHFITVLQAISGGFEVFCREMHVLCFS